ncbi:Hypothetical predicted protein [Olea europaea subsp. europaea]|uniref:F-box/LRR-repeat protein 15/At3g58940/PEG3-like LRR domain-containing protein n=1 Tax=Olea europaea subsp. europaea TaxID=158383 RepID=A0A8S0UPA2_OLEEU|nr:Hypothetical predicted protein [Olea europaea subsp. europaea]
MKIAQFQPVDMISDLPDNVIAIILMCLVKAMESSAKLQRFNRLITLELLDVIVDTDVLGSLISSSPELEQLALHVRAGFHHLTIDAPKLKLVKLKCFRAYVYFKKSLTTLCYNSIIHRKYNFIEFFDSLPALQQLCIDYRL